MSTGTARTTWCWWGTSFYDGVSAFVLFGGDELPAEFDLEASEAEGVLAIEGLEGDLGFQPGGVGDLDGDGFDDLVLVPVRGEDPITIDAYLVFGAEDRHEGAVDVELEDGDRVSSLAGITSSLFTESRPRAAGDLDGDGFGDAVISPGITDYYYAGTAFVLFGGEEHPAAMSASGPAPAWLARLGDAAVYSQVSGAPAGDLDGDGFDDLILGDGFRYSAYSGYGAGVVLLGSGDGLPGQVAPASPDPSLRQIIASYGYSFLGSAVEGGFDFRTARRRPRRGPVDRRRQRPRPRLHRLRLRPPRVERRLRETAAVGLSRRAIVRHPSPDPSHASERLPPPGPLPRARRPARLCDRDHPPRGRAGRAGARHPAPARHGRARPGAHLLAAGPPGQAGATTRWASAWATASTWSVWPCATRAGWR